MAKAARVIRDTLLATGRFDLTRTEIEVDRGRRLDAHAQRTRSIATAKRRRCCSTTPKRGVVTLVKQFRAGAYLSDGALATIEVCAGMLDGDPPEVCAIREALEETGIAIREPVHAFDAYMSPGGMTEKIACFVAPYGEADRTGQGRRRRRGRAYRGPRDPVRRGARDDRARRDRRRQDDRAPLLRQGEGAHGIRHAADALANPGGFSTAVRRHRVVIVFCEA